MTRLRPAFLLSLLIAVALLGAACGGSDEGGEEVSAGTDVDELLTRTFTGAKTVDSGKLDLKLRIDAEGGESQLDGPISVRLAGPFQVEDAGKLPRFALDAALKGAGQSISAGATSTGKKGYLSFQGTDYVVEGTVFQQFKAAFEEAQKAGDDKQSQSFASLGMDPRKWLTNPTNAGDAKVGDDAVIKITGGVDVAKLLDDVNTALGKASALGLQGTGEVPEKLTEAQRRQVLEAVEDPRVEIYTGKDDQIMRRMVVNMSVNDGETGTSGDVAFDLSITDLNEDQDIAEPADAKPFDQLLGQLGGLGLGAGGGGSGGGSSADLEKFSQCLTEAGEDVEKARKCSELLPG